MHIDKKFEFYCMTIVYGQCNSPNFTVATLYNGTFYNVRTFHTNGLVVQPTLTSTHRVYLVLSTSEMHIP
jgi:hypothetical protein